MKGIKWLDEKFEESLLVILLVLIACVSMLQVIVRKVPFLTSLEWSDEFCRFCWIYSVFLSVPYTIRQSSMLRVGVVMDMLPSKVHKVVNMIVEAINCVCMALLGYNSISVVNGYRTSGTVSAAMGWPMWIIYAIMILGFWLAAVRAVQQIIHIAQHFNERELSTTELTMQEAAAEAAAAKGGDE